MRLARTGLHLLWGMATVAFAFPFLPLRARRALRSRWSRQLLATLGVRLRVAGTPPAAGLLVANHISWLDIYAINATLSGAFVSKDEVRRWPLIGWLAARNETIFLERGSRSAALRAKERLAGALRQRNCVAVFPEGTTSDGAGLLPFHSALFQSAIDAGTPVMPLALRYCGAAGEPAAAPVYVGDTTLWQCLRAIAAADRLTAELIFLPALDPAGVDRRQLAHRAHQCIGAARRQGVNVIERVEAPMSISSGASQIVASPREGEVGRGRAHLPAGGVSPRSPGA